MTVTSHDSKLGVLLSQPNNNYNPNYKTTKTLVWLRLNNGRETTHHRNSKLHDRAKIEQYSEKKLSIFIMRPKNSLLGPQIVKTTPKIVYMGLQKVKNGPKIK